MCFALSVDHVPCMTAAVIVFNIKSIIHRFIKKIGLLSESFTGDKYQYFYGKKFFDRVQIDFFLKEVQRSSEVTKDSMTR